MKNLIIDERMRLVEKQLLQNLGYNLIEIKKSNNVYEEISSHVDIFTCKIKDQIIIEKSKFDEISMNCNSRNLIMGDSKIEEKYPYDIKYNVCILGNKAIHKFKYTDNKIKQILLKEKYELINVEQGYTNCSIVVIDENTAITQDKGIYKKLIEHKIDTLLIENNIDIKLLNNGNYSGKNGFIGGAISKIGKDIIVFGDLVKIDIDNKIRNFIKKRNLKIIDFKGLDVIDYGGIVEF